jgi:hypothetical protein
MKMPKEQWLNTYDGYIDTLKRVELDIGYNLYLKPGCVVGFKVDCSKADNLYGHTLSAPFIVCDPVLFNGHGGVTSSLQKKPTLMHPRGDDEPSILQIVMYNAGFKGTYMSYVGNNSPGISSFMKVKRVRTETKKLNEYIEHCCTGPNAGAGWEINRVEVTVNFKPEQINSFLRDFDWSLTSLINNVLPLQYDAASLDEWLVLLVGVHGIENRAVSCVSQPIKKVLIVMKMYSRLQQLYRGWYSGRDSHSAETHEYYLLMQLMQVLGFHARQKHRYQNCPYTWEPSSAYQMDMGPCIRNKKEYTSGVQKKMIELYIRRLKGWSIEDEDFKPEFKEQLHKEFLDAQHGHPVEDDDVENPEANYNNANYTNAHVQEMLKTLKFYKKKGLHTAGYRVGGKFPTKFLSSTKLSLCIKLANAFGAEWRKKLKLKDKPIIDLSISSNNNGITIGNSSSSRRRRSSTRSSSSQRKTQPSHHRRGTKRIRPIREDESSDEKSDESSDVSSDESSDESSGEKGFLCSNSNSSSSSSSGSNKKRATWKWGKGGKKRGRKH